jgi:hypothetical protein
VCPNLTPRGELAKELGVALNGTEPVSLSGARNRTRTHFDNAGMATNRVIDESDVVRYLADFCTFRTFAHHPAVVTDPASFARRLRARMHKGSLVQGPQEDPTHPTKVLLSALTVLVKARVRGCF